MEILALRLKLGGPPPRTVLEEVEARLRSLHGVREVVRLVVPDGVELYFGLQAPAAAVLEGARRVLSEAAPGEAIEADSGEEAFRHLVLLVAGLGGVPADGAVELVRAAYAEAVARRAAGAILSPNFHRAFRAARRIRAKVEEADASSLVEQEMADYRAWKRERELGPTVLRLGRLLELVDLPRSGSGRGGGRELRRALLRGFVSVASDAASEPEALSRLSLFEEALRRAASATRPASAASRLAGGVVSLVGAGPGDPGLLTVRGAERLGEADVVYYDALVSEATLLHCRAGARLVPVGKRRGAAAMPQREIESALVRDARAGLAVVRLKGGDPFVFGRGGEEALALLRSGIPFEIVPGLSSGLAVPALAGIPLTHRGVASSAAFVTAHDLGREDLRDRLTHLARGADTLVVFMAGAEIGRVRDGLVAAGLPAETPVATIQSGTLPEESVALGTIGSLPPDGGSHRSGPVLLVVGKTVALSEELRAGACRWAAELQEVFEGNPRLGRRAHATGPRSHRRAG